tara:strand:- start:675 stop:785 length:111 start_codon:yes stop_codon:yes gene_type:complete
LLVVVLVGVFQAPVALTTAAALAVLGACYQALVLLL